MISAFWINPVLICLVLEAVHCRQQKDVHLIGQVQVFGLCSKRTALETSKRLSL